MVAAAMQDQQIGIHYLAQGHFGMQTRGFKPATFQ